jgi:probable rRNA maturation factor
MNKINIRNKCSGFQLSPELRLIIRRSASGALAAEHLDNFEMTVWVVDNKTIREFNNKFRRKDIATDVLSFPMGENGVFSVNPENGMKILGDTILSIERAAAQAIEYGHSAKRETAFLIVHSVLHLVGYDHEKGPVLARKMREREEDILSSLGYTR